MTLSLVSAVNDDGVLRSCLVASPDATTMQVVTQRGFSSAALAYNDAWARCTGDVVIFVHQDVYLPAGWRAQFERALTWLERHDPQWGVLGLCGKTAGGETRGWVYSSGLGAVVGAPFSQPQEVRTLDEVLLAVRPASGLRFDDALPGFHMYGTDICLAAEQAGRRNYVVPCFAIHNSNGLRQLPWAFWKSCLHIRRRWRARLPVQAPCTTVSAFPHQTAWQLAERFVRFSIRRRAVGRRAADPGALHRDLIATGRVPPAVL